MKDSVVYCVTVYRTDKPGYEALYSNHVYDNKPAAKLKAYALNKEVESLPEKQQVYKYLVNTLTVKSKADV